MNFIPHHIDNFNIRVMKIGSGIEAIGSDGKEGNFANPPASGQKCNYNIKYNIFILE